MQDQLRMKNLLCLHSVLYKDVAPVCFRKADLHCELVTTIKFYYMPLCNSDAEGHEGIKVYGVRQTAFQAPWHFEQLIKPEALTDQHQTQTGVSAFSLHMQ